jgi:hypothetical protein
MTSQDRGRDRIGKKLVKKRRESTKGPRGVSLDIPERFKDGDDAHEDVTAPKRNNAVSMNHSLCSMIARAGQHSHADLGTMQEVDSGDSDDEGKRKTSYYGLDGAARLSRLSSANDFQTPPGPSDQRAEKSSHRRALSENKLLRSLPKLRMGGKKDVRSGAQGDDQMSSSQFLPPRQPAEVPPLSPANEQYSRTKASAVHAEEIPVEKTRSRRKSQHGSETSLAKSKGPMTLADRIQQIFDFEDVEEVISEYPCWLLQSILLQGYMYITQKHLCFYAYMPRKHVRFQHVPTLARATTHRANIHSMTSARRAIFPSTVDLSTTDTGSSYVETFWRTIPIRQSCTFPGIASTFSMLYLLKLSRARRRARRRRRSSSKRTNERTSSRQTAQQVRRSGSDPSKKSYSAHTTRAIASRSRSRYKTLSRSKRVPY